VAQARAATVAALAVPLAQAPAGPFARAAIALDQAGEGEAAPLADLLRRNRAQDAAAGRAVAGPHRADLVVTHAGTGQPPARCSTGEQKALLLNLVLAHAELVGTRSDRPLILLLDEVAAHLDASRRQALWERLAATGSQVWLTGTEPALFEGAGERTTWLHVAAGDARPVVPS
jgi:DNA replication and repair protein RecF